MKLTGFNYVTEENVEKVLTYFETYGTIGLFFETTSVDWIKFLTGKDGDFYAKIPLEDDETRIAYFEEIETAKAMLIIACSVTPKNIYACYWCNHISSKEVCNCEKCLMIENILY